MERHLFRICEAEEGQGEFAEPGREFHLSARVGGLLNDVARFQIRRLLNHVKHLTQAIAQRIVFKFTTELLNILDEQKLEVKLIQKFKSRESP